MGMLPEIEELYPEGSDITIMNTQYTYPVFEDGKKVSDDKLYLVYKDNKDDSKHLKVINRPNYTYYRIKEGENIPNYSQLFIEREKVDACTVEYSKLEKSIAESLDKLDEYKYNLYNHNKMANRIFHTEPSIFYSDANIEDHYRFKFANTYTNNINKISKGFFDIEVDGKWAAGDFVQMGECAINCVSYFNNKNNTIYVFILRDYRNKMIEEFEQSIVSGKFTLDEIREFIIDTVGGIKRAKKYNLDTLQFVFNFYDEEIDLIRELFETIHSCSPDFVLSYNGSAFDIPYIIQRIINLGYNPEDIMCDQRFSDKIVKNYVDTRHLNELAERGDYTFITGLSIFIDQMIQYASRRKAKIGSYASFKLDDIGLLEAKVKKLDYSHITKDVTELPWLDFKTFVLYNIMDTVVQKCIEEKTKDLEYIFAKCIVNNTIYRKGHRQTVYLINRMTADWYKMGFIIGNNINKNNVKDTKFLGALVGNPDHTNDYAKMKIEDIVLWLCENLIDYD